MTNGDTVMIYEDPLIEMKPEGTATLIRKYADINNLGPLRLWAVEFTSDPGEYFTRWIREA